MKRKWRQRSVMEAKGAQALDERVCVHYDTSLGRAEERGRRAQPLSGLMPSHGYSGAGSRQARSGVTAHHDGVVVVVGRVETIEMIDHKPCM